MKTNQDKNSVLTGATILVGTVGLAMLCLRVVRLVSVGLVFTRKNRNRNVKGCLYEPQVKDQLIKK